MAKKDKFEPERDESVPDLARIMSQLEMLDHRLDSVDSIVSAVAERVMTQPVTLNITCSKCGNRIEIALIGTEKPSR